MTKARTISQYNVYGSNIANAAITLQKITLEPYVEDWGLITDLTITESEDYSIL